MCTVPRRCSASAYGSEADARSYQKVHGVCSGCSPGSSSEGPVAVAMRIMGRKLVGTRNHTRSFRARARMHAVVSFVSTPGPDTTIHVLTVSLRSSVVSALLGSSLCYRSPHIGGLYNVIERLTIINTHPGSFTCLLREAAPLRVRRPSSQGAPAIGPRRQPPQNRLAASQPASVLGPGRRGRWASQLVRNRSLTDWYSNLRAHAGHLRLRTSRRF